MMTSEIKEQVEEILSFCSNNTGERFIGRRLCALLRDLDAESPKPTGEQLKHYSCIGCGCFPAYPGPVCESCFDRTTNPILRRNYTPKEPEPAAPGVNCL